LADVATIEGNASGLMAIGGWIRIDHADGHSEACGFASTISAEQADDFGAFDREGNVIDDDAACVGLAEFVGLEQGHRDQCTSNAQGAA